MSVTLDDVIDLLDCRILQSELRQDKLADDNQAVEQAKFQGHFDDQSSAVDRRRPQLGQSRQARLQYRSRRYVLSGPRDGVFALESSLQRFKFP